MTAIVAPMTDSAVLADLLEEVSLKNHVRVVHYRAIKRRNARTIHRKVMDELADPAVALGPALLLQDSVRVLAGKKPIYLAEAFRRLGGELRSIRPNLRVNDGIDYVSAQLGGSALAAANVADYIALSNNTISPAATDGSDTLPWSTAEPTDGAPSATRGEYTGVGMTRAQATYAHSSPNTYYTMAHTWTATGTVTSVRMAGLFGGTAKTTQGNSANNILFLENTFTATTLSTDDQLSLTWTVNI